MKKLFYAIAVMTLFGSCGTRYYLPNSVTEPNLNDVVQAIQSQYVSAMDSLSKAGIVDFKLSTAAISLKVVEKNTGGGDITILIFKPSAKYIQTNTTTITFTLGKAPSLAGGAGPKVVGNNLHAAIVSAVKSFHNLNTSIGNLPKQSVVVDVDFSIEYDVTLGLTFKVWGFGTDVNLETDHTADHDLKLTFVPAP